MRRWITTKLIGLGTTDSPLEPDVSAFSQLNGWALAVMPAGAKAGDSCLVMVDEPGGPSALPVKPGLALVGNEGEPNDPSGRVIGDTLRGKLETEAVKLGVDAKDWNPEGYRIGPL